MTEQGLYFATQNMITGAGFIEKDCPLAWIKIERLITEFFDLFLSIEIRIHRGSLFGPAWTTVEIEEALYQAKDQSSQDPLNFPIRLNNKLAALLGVVSRSETPPNEQSFAVYDELTAQINAQLQKLSQIIKTDVPAFNQLVKDQNIPAIVVKPPVAGESPR